MILGHDSSFIWHDIMVALVGSLIGSFIIMAVAAALIDLIALI